MNRRKFLTASASGVGGAIVAERTILAQAVRQSSSNKTALRLAGMSLTELRGAYRRDLFEDFLPFIERFVIDKEHGGFMCLTDYTGERESDKKLSWFEGRGSWVYAFLYNNFGRDPKYLDVARRSLEFVMRSKPKGVDELWAKELSRDGKPLTPPDTEVYGDLFIAEGLAEYSKATGQRSFWNEAKNLILKCVKIYDRPDYRPTIGQTYLGPNARAYPGARIQGVWMVLIRVITQMLSIHSDATLDGIASRCIEALRDRHWNPKLRLNNELLNHDLSRPENEYEQLVYTGHCIETLWMAMLEADRRKDSELFETFAERFRRHVDVAWDDVYGGVFRDLMKVDENVWTLDKVLWAQEEVLIGSLLVYEKTGAEWARTLFERAYEYVHKTYPLKAYGSPLWMYAGNRKVQFEEFKTRPKRVENYHHPRHLMLNLLSLERMIARNRA